MPKEQKYGHVSGPKPNRNILMKGLQEIRAQSGRFITIDPADGFAAVALGASTLLQGFLEDGDRSIPAGDGLVPLTRIIPNLVDRFQIPINGGTTLVRNMIGRTCDLSIVSDIQGANLVSSNTDVVLILDGDFEDSDWVIVQYNPARLIGYAGVV